MIQSFLLAAAFAVLVYLCTRADTESWDKTLIVRLLPVLLGVGFIFRLITAVSAAGYETDINTFKAWAAMVYETPWKQVYDTAGFLDYPPGYLYVLWAMEALRRLFGLAFDSAGATLLIKLPSILADLACAFLLYRLAKRKLGENRAFLGAALYLFCPAVWVNSAVWGQADGFCILLLFASLLLMLDSHYLPAALLYGVSILCKPQMLAFIPLYVAYPLRQKAYKQLAAGVGVTLGVGLLLALPFTQHFNFVWLFQKYVSTMGYYNYFTINAYNFYGLIGLNWGSLDSLGWLSTLLTVLSCAAATGLAVWIIWRSRREGALFAAGAVLMATVFLFCPKMHERYLFPVLLLLLGAWAVSNDRRMLFSFGIFSALHYLNVAYVLYLDNTYVSPFSPMILLLSAGQLAAWWYLLYAVWKGFLCDQALIQKSAPAAHSKSAPQKKQPVQHAQTHTLEPKPAASPLNRWDFILCTAITLVFAAVSFTGLGTTSMPQTVWRAESGDDVVFRMSGETDSIRFLPGIATNGSDRTTDGVSVTFYTSVDGRDWTLLGSVQAGTLFSWEQLDAAGEGTYLRLQVTGDTVLCELAAKAAGQDTFLTLTPLSDGCEALVDEQDTVPLYRTPYNSAYFDEIYHPRTAYEHILGCEPYENTHPTLGKLIMSVGIRMFGMNPFGWRCMGALFGVLMLPVLYHLIRQLFGRTKWAVFGTLLFALDFMHFTQTRIGTIDTFALLFILLMYDAMVVFLKKDLFSPLISLLVPLGICGIFVGLGAASKWTAIYAAAGLAVLYFGKLFVTWRDTPTKQRAILLKRMEILCLWCCLFFIVVPFAIYFAAFLPVTLLPQNADHIWSSFWSYQTHMLSYHAGLTATHDFASLWYEWPLMLRPIWYFFNADMTGSGQIGTIVCMGNPPLWWAGLAAMIAVLIAAMRDRSLAARVTAVGFLAAYLPWVGISRTTFIYHYFSAVPMLCLALVYVFWKLDQTAKPLPAIGPIKTNAVTLSMAGFMLLLFIFWCLFWPVISGSPTSSEAVHALEWLPGWYFAP